MTTRKGCDGVLSMSCVRIDEWTLRVVGLLPRCGRCSNV